MALFSPARLVDPFLVTSVSIVKHVLLKYILLSPPPLARFYLTENSFKNMSNTFHWYHTFLQN
jgi:hypothetical protein